jgi:hypothetical protein
MGDKHMMATLMVVVLRVEESSRCLRLDVKLAQVVSRCRLTGQRERKQSSHVDRTTRPGVRQPKISDARSRAQCQALDEKHKRIMFVVGIQHYSLSAHCSFSQLSEIISA